MSRALLSVTESVELADAPADVWQRIGRFEDMRWHPAVARLEMVDDLPAKAGSRRLLTTVDGAQLLEVLISHSDAQRAYRYQIRISPLPVADYDSTIGIEAIAGGGCTVTWRSTFHRLEASGLDDDAVRAIVSGIYRTGLDVLAAPQ